MVTVYVWSPRSSNGQKNVGHASALVNPRTYISWWPDEAAGPFRDFYPIRNKTFESDVDDEGHAPDHQVRLQGLDEKSILDWWASFGLVRNGQLLQGPMLPYNLTKQNCSTVVATALKRGGGDRYARWFSSWSIVWRPDTILDYALSIEKGLAKR